MQDELRQKKILYYTIIYFTNLNYLIVLLLLSFYFEFDKDPFLSIVIWGIPASITILFSTIVVRHNILHELSKEQGIFKLAICHIPSILGLIGALVYLFIM